MKAFPFQSNYMGNDEHGNPLFDRAVDSSFFWDFWELYFQTGVFGKPDSNFQVFADSGMRLRVKGGACFIRGVTGMQEADIYLTLGAASPTIGRVDRIVLQRNGQQRDILVLVKDASAPLIRNSDIWELALADVQVRAGVSEITQSDITDLRGDTDLCGFVVSTVDASAAVPLNHASAEATFGLGSGAKYGHVKLSDALNSNYDSLSGYAATPAAIKALAGLVDKKVQITEGTWTPTLIGLSGGQMPSYTVQAGTYLRFGDWCILIFNVGTFDVMATRLSGAVAIGGVPFSSNSIVTPASPLGGSTPYTTADNGYSYGFSCALGIQRNYLRISTFGDRTWGSGYSSEYDASRNSTSSGGTWFSGTYLYKIE